MGRKTVATSQLSCMHSGAYLLDTGCDCFHPKVKARKEGSSEVMTCK